MSAYRTDHCLMKTKHDSLVIWRMGECFLAIFVKNWDGEKILKMNNSIIKGADEPQILYTWNEEKLC